MTSRTAARTAQRRTGPATPAVLLAYQQAWVADNAPVAVWEKSRRIGASWCDASQAVLTAAAEGGQDALYIGYSEDMTREYIDDCALWAKSFAFAVSWLGEVVYADEERDIKAFRIDFASGKKILALSSRPRSIRGKQGRVTIDEAAFHDDLPGLMKASLAMLIWGGKVRLLSSHNGDENPFNELVQQIRAGRLAYSLHRTTFQEAVAQGLYARVALILGERLVERSEAEWVDQIYAQYGETAAEELDCIPSQGGGAWLPRALIEARMADAPVLRWKPPASDFTVWSDTMRSAEMRDWLDAHVRPVLATLDATARSGFGMDFGRSGDLTVLLVYQITQALRRRFALAIELSDCPFDQQREVLFYVGVSLPRLTAGKLDARGNGQYLSEKAVQKWGAARIEAVMLTQGWYRDHSAPFKAALEDGMVELIRDADHLDDLRAFQIIGGIPLLPDRRTRGQDGSQRHGDAGVAYLLAYAASRADPVAVTHGYQSVPRRSLADEGADDAEYPTRRML